MTPLPATTTANHGTTRDAGIPLDDMDETDSQWGEPPRQRDPGWCDLQKVTIFTIFCIVVLAIVVALVLKYYTIPSLPPSDSTSS
jgi:hypothetical protein